MFAGMLQPKEGKLFGCAIIYFIVGYELMINFLSAMSSLMELE